jgi:hypothetical protein
MGQGNGWLEYVKKKAAPRSANRLTYGA